MQCRFCIAFGHEEKVGAKRQPTIVVQGWTRPFRYDNIETHLSSQHPTKYAEYKLLDSVADRHAFFDDVPVAFKNSMKAHFPSSFLGVERQIVFDLKKGIVDVIVGNMMFNIVDVVDSDADNDEEDIELADAFGSNAECHAVRHQRSQKAALAKERALSLFWRMDHEVERVASYSYSVTIPKSKTTVFQLVVRYVSVGA